MQHCGKWPISFKLSINGSMDLGKLIEELAAGKPIIVISNINGVTLPTGEGHIGLGAAIYDAYEADPEALIQAKVEKSHVLIHLAIVDPQHPTSAKKDPTP